VLAFATSHFGDVFLFMTFHLHKPGNVIAGHILIVKVRYVISCQLQAITREMQCTVTIIKFFFSLIKYIMYITITLNRIIQSLYYSLASRCINAWMHLTRIIQSLYYAALVAALTPGCIH
jgi:hypothetical protein